MIRPAEPQQSRKSRRGTRFVDGAVEAAHAKPTNPSPHGDLRAAGSRDICRVSSAVWADWRTESGRREQGIGRLLEHLALFPGEDWQQRWQASGLDTYGQPVYARFSTKHTAWSAGAGAEALFCLRVIRPSLEGLRTNRFTAYPETFRVAQADPGLDELFTYAAGLDMSRPHFLRLLNDICVALTVQGIALQDLTPEAFAAYTLDSRLLPVSGDRRRCTGHLAWETLCSFGHFPKQTARTLKSALLPRQLTPPELVDRYPVANQDVRQLLISYLERRGHDMDYTSLSGLAINLVKNFWAKIEKLAPSQPDLHLPPELYGQWREQMRYLDDKVTLRVDPDSPLMAVRALYFDLQAWALHDPASWAQWVAPCPISAVDTKGGGQRRRRINERMAGRTRLRQPLLPLLASHVEAKHLRLAALLHAANQAGHGKQFTHNGQTYQRVFSHADKHRLDAGHTVHVRLTDLDTGQTIPISRIEDAAFWEWAIVEVLRHTGIRVEELTELSQLSIRQYRRPNGEVVALLVIAPSKSDRERVIPMSAELFHVIAMIIRRLTARRRTVPMVSMFDNRERAVVGPLPLLFQRPVGGRQQVFTGGGVYCLLRRVCTELAGTHPEFEGIRFSPHDFRRIFTTDLVNSGLPIHIGAALLGHLNIETTRGYVAVFEEDVIVHYQQYLSHRRDMRPSEEYQPVTAAEWTEFEEHFDKRKVELGSCARPYQTPCTHEHACIRCPMLHIDPGMLARLDELETDLLRRMAEAQARGWLGEIEGIQLTLQFLNGKRGQARRLGALPPVNLGMPGVIARTGPHGAVTGAMIGE